VGTAIPISGSNTVSLVSVIHIIMAYTYTCVNENYAFILERLTNDHVKSSPTITCTSQRWFHSPDGGGHYTELNTSSSKYYLIENDLLKINLNNVSASDEGIYGCLDSTNNRINAVCITVYGESC
jgi:hypothetical protein